MMRGRVGLVSDILPMSELAAPLSRRVKVRVFPRAKRDAPAEEVFPTIHKLKQKAPARPAAVKLTAGDCFFSRDQTGAKIIGV